MFDIFCRSTLLSDTDTVNHADLGIHKEDDEDIATFHKEKPTNYSLYTAVVFFGVLTLCRCTLVLCAQMAVTKNNIFQLQALRYILQTIVTFCTAFLRKELFPVKSYQLFYLTLNFFCYYASGISFYLAASFMPVGSLDACYGMFCIFFATMYDALKRLLCITDLVILLVVLSGMVCVWQPWMSSYETKIIPCMFLQNYITNDDVQSDILNTTEERIIYNFTSPPQSQNRYAILNPVIVGYSLLLISGMLIVVSGHVVKKLLDELPPSTLALFDGVCGTCTSLVACVILIIMSGNGHPSFFQGHICSSFLFLYAFAGCLVPFAWYYSLMYISLSKIAIGNGLLLFVLYIFQRTALKRFHPGHANKVEVLGILTILLGTLCVPACERLKKIRLGKVRPQT